MGVWFHIEGDEDYMEEDRFVNVSTAQAPEFFQWLRVPADPFMGRMQARELAALCRARCWPQIHEDGDEGRPKRTVTRHRRPAWLFRWFTKPSVETWSARPAGLYDAKAQKLLTLAGSAGERCIVWG